jgi:hypothetical protein
MLSFIKKNNNNKSTWESGKETKKQSEEMLRKMQIN